MREFLSRESNIPRPTFPTCCQVLFLSSALAAGVGPLLIMTWTGKFGDPMAMGMDLQTIYAAPPPSESDEGAAAGAAISDISLSCWNPPPGPRALKGDLAYVRVQTAKGAIAHFVAHTRGFYLSRTTDTSFDPTEHSEHSCRSHTLSGSLEQYCPIFKSRMSGHVEAQRDRNLLEVLPAP